MNISRYLKLAISIIVVFGIASAVFADPPRMDFPRVGKAKYEVLCGDFHMHTSFSDGGLSVEERLNERKELGYNVAAVADHSTTKGCAIAQQVGKSLGLVIINAFETGSATPGTGDHMVCLGVPEDFEVRDGHVMALNPGGPRVFYQDEMKRIQEAGGILLYAHPNYGSVDGVQPPVAAGGNVRIVNHIMPDPVAWGIKNGYVIGIEVQNGWGDVDFGWGIDKFDDIWCYPHSFPWALEHNLAVFANSDIHGPNRHTNQPITLVFTSSRDADGVMDAIRSRRTAAWFNDMVWGHQPLLADLARAVLGVKRGSDKKIVLENKSPMVLKCALTSAPGDVVKIGPYETVTTDWKSRSSVKILLANFYTSLTTNLEVKFRPSR